ncbi:MAG: hypothetical protein H7145_03250 [Akkermansiaceae bacterium]|nr:hypothetical protein [Armatimonadota bacterium]
MTRRSPNGFGTSNNGRIARAIYLHSILPTLKPEDHGKYLCIDCDTGEWELAEIEPDAHVRVWRSNPAGRNWVMIRKHDNCGTELHGRRGGRLSRRRYLRAGHFAHS